MAEPVVSCVDLERRYDDGGVAVNVLNGVSLSVAAGETVAVTGASGSGKSTLLHLLGGLDRPSAGEVTLAGQSLASAGEAKLANLRNRELGFVYQFHHLLPEFSARENVAMPLLIAGVSPGEAGERASAMLARVELAARSEHRPAELSGGERQRVAIARALVNRPRCLLADEPTGNLDQRNAIAVAELMLSIAEEASAALVVVTHDHAIAALMQRCYTLSEGCLVDN